MAPRINTPFYRCLLFFPTPIPLDFPGPPTIEGIAGEDIYFDGSMSQRLNGWLYLRTESPYTILFSHGNSGNLTIRHHLCRLMLLSGFSVFVYDYQGFGRSTGKPTVEGICSDGAAAFDYLVGKRGVDPARIVLYGESLGVSVASHLSSIRQCRGLVLQSGFSSLRTIASEHFPLLRIYPKALFPSPPLDNIEILKASMLPVLLIHGELDRVIPVKHSIDMYHAASGPKRFLRLPGTAHGDLWTTAEREYVETLSSFPDELDASVSKSTCESSTKE
jgi:hypothetical protein